MALTNPNPSTNPGMTLRCNNCDYAIIPPATVATPTVWDWNTPVGTEVGEIDEYDATKPNEINVRHPHCPTCGSPSVTIIATFNNSMP